MTDCTHPRHNVSAKMNYMEDTGRWMCDFEVTCAACGLPFEFHGVDPGFSFNKPTISVDARTLSVPIMPQGTMPTPLDLIGASIKGRH